jgi:hypothetical protein
VTSHIVSWTKWRGVFMYWSVHGFFFNTCHWIPLVTSPGPWEVAS